SLEQFLAQVVRETATAHAKRVAVSCNGLELIPVPWRRAARDIVIHMARNAVVHGIESPEKRLAASKPETAAIRVSFESSGAESFVLTVEDDGQGLPYERI